jgi:hypothetical protein
MLTLTPPSHTGSLLHSHMIGVKVSWSECMTVHSKSSTLQSAVSLEDTHTDKGKKVNLPLCSTKHYSTNVNGGVDPRFLDLGTSWRWVASLMPLLLYPRESALGTRRTRDWVGPEAGLDDTVKWTFLAPPRLEPRPIGRPARRQSLPQLSDTHTGTRGKSRCLGFQTQIVNIIRPEKGENNRKMGFCNSFPHATDNAFLMHSG